MPAMAPSCTKHERLPWPAVTATLDDAADADGADGGDESAAADTSPSGREAAAAEPDNRGAHALREPLQKAIQRKGAGTVEALLRSGALVCDEYRLDGERGGATGTALDLLLLERRYGLALKLLQRASAASDDSAEAGDATAAGGEQQDTGEAISAIVRASVHAVAWAARDGRTEILDLLLRHGADPGQRDEKGRPALLLAALRGRLPCARLLLAAEGARDGDGEAVRLCSDEEREEAEAWLAHWKFQPPDSAEAAAEEEASPPEQWQGDLSEVALRSHGAQAVQRWPEWRLRSSPLEKRTAHGQLAHAIKHKSVKDVEQLVLNGAALVAADYPLDERGKDYGTALDLALVSRRYQLAERLLALAGDEAEELARGSSRALAWAARDGREALVRELLRHAADPGCCDELGRSALLLATMRGHGQCVELLLGAGAWSAEAAASQAQVREWAAHWKFPPPG